MAMLRRLYRFGAFSIDPAARELTRGGARVPLPVSTFDCLAYLIEHRERAIGRDELIAAVWGRSDVSDTLLSQAIVQLRHAFGDSRTEQQVIRTIPRLGYRWVAAIDLHEGGDADAPAERAPGERLQRASRKPRIETMHAKPMWLAGALALALVVAALGAWFLRGARDPIEPSVQRASAGPAVDVAVLPVESGEGSEWSWLRLGLMDLIGEELRSAGVSVVPSNNIVAIARADAAADDDRAALVRAATGARYVVRPRASRSAGSWIVHLEIGSADGSTRSADAADADVIAAGRGASARLLVLLGKPAPPDRTAERAPSELMQQIKAALLTDNLEGARRLLESAPPALADKPELVVQRAALDFASGDPDSAERRLRALLEQLPAETEPAWRARVQSGLGAIAIRFDRYEAAERAYGEAVSLLEAGGDPARLGRAYMGRAAAESALGRYEPALADFARARVALELAGDALELARVEENEGVLDAQRGRHADALQLFGSAEARFQRFGSAAGQVKTISNAIGAHLALLDAAGALAASDRGWPLLARIGDDMVRRVFEYERARALAANGRLTEAQALLGRLEREADAEREVTLRAQARAELARFELVAGHAAEAEALAASAIDALGAGGIYARDRARVWLIHVRALRGTDKRSEAMESIGRLKVWADDHAETPAAIYAALAEAELRRGERGGEAARPLYRAALQKAERGAVPLDVATVALSYGGSLIADGDLAEASVVVGQVARFADRDYDCAALQAEMYRALGRDEAWRKAAEVARRLAGERALPGDR